MSMLMLIVSKLYITGEKLFDVIEPDDVITVILLFVISSIYIIESFNIVKFF